MQKPNRKTALRNLSSFALGAVGAELFGLGWLLMLAALIVVIQAVRWTLYFNNGDKQL